MTTWTMEQVRQVQALRLKIGVNRVELSTGSPDFEEHLRRYCAGKIQEAARTFAVEVHEDDVAIIRLGGEDEDFHSVRFRTRWDPQWRHPEQAEVEFRGGERDGLLMAVQPQVLEHGLIVPRPVLVPWTSENPSPDLPIGYHEERYVVVGWREFERRWVMGLANPQ